MYYKNEDGYIELLKHTLNGDEKTTRNGNVLSLFGIDTLKYTMLEMLLVCSDIVYFNISISSCVNS